MLRMTEADYAEIRFAVTRYLHTLKALKKEQQRLDNAVSTVSGWLMWDLEREDVERLEDGMTRYLTECCEALGAVRLIAQAFIQDREVQESAKNYTPPLLKFYAQSTIVARRLLSAFKDSTALSTTVVFNYTKESGAFANCHHYSGKAAVEFLSSMGLDNASDATSLEVEHKLLTTLFELIALLPPASFEEKSARERPSTDSRLQKYADHLRERLSA